MGTYLFVYHGGGMPESEEEGAKEMQAWQAWLEGAGAQVVDGGNPVGPSTTVTSGSVVNDGGANPTTGYGLFSADSLDAAVALAQGCPILASGGSVEVAETFEP